MKMLEKDKIIAVKFRNGDRLVSLTEDNDDELSVDAAIKRLQKVVPLIS